MNTQISTAKSIDWNKVLRVTSRFAWALIRLLFKVTYIVGSSVLGFFTAWFASGDNHDYDEDKRQRDEEDYQLQLYDEERKRRG